MASSKLTLEINTESVKSWLEKADIVPVVRCKDCKHRHDDGYCEVWGDAFYHWEDFDEVPEDMFCGYGERRENETND